MKAISLFSDVLGPVMRGPSSSHTAAPFTIGTMARALLGDEPIAATFTFDPGGSFGQVYQQQGSDLGFAAGLLGWSITDERFSQALVLAAGQGLAIRFAVEPLARADHPNSVEIRLVGRRGARLHMIAKSIGGGAVVVDEIDGWPVHLTGDAHDHIGDRLAGFALGIFHGKTDGALEAFHVGDGAAGEAAGLLAPGARDAEGTRAGAVIASDQAGDLRAADIQRCDGAGVRTPHTGGTAGLNIGHQLRRASSRALKSGVAIGSR